MYAITGFWEVSLSKLSFSAGLSPVIAQQGIGLPFSIIKLLMLIGWVYACLYTIQRLQFNPLVPAKAKTIVNVVGLFLGPILFLLLLITDTIFNYSGIQTGFAGRIKENVQQTIAGLKSLQAPLSKHTREIILLHSSGKEIREVYGGDKIAKQDRHILKLTD